MHCRGENVIQTSVFIRVRDMTPEIRNSSLLDNGSKGVPAEMYTHATIQELPFL
jgi:hypothetical protein